MGGKRTLDIALLTVSGTVNRFYAFVDRRRVIAADGTETPTWSGKVASSGVVLKVRVWGIADARYLLSIDLPGTVDDQKLTFTLDGGYHECKLVI